MSEIFFMWGAAFYIMTAVFFVLFTICAAYDEYPGGTLLSLVLFFVMAFWWGDLGGAIKADPYRLLYLPAWIVAGLIWSCPRWAIFLLRAKANYVEGLEEYIQRFNLPPHEQWNQKQREAWFDSNCVSSLRYNLGLQYDVISGRVTPPPFSKNKRRLVSWVLLWPFSIFWTFCRDGIVRLVEMLTDLLGNIYQNISEWIFKDV